MKKQTAVRHSASTCGYQPSLRKRVLPPPQSLTSKNEKATNSLTSWICGYQKIAGSMLCVATWTTSYTL